MTHFFVRIGYVCFHCRHTDPGRTFALPPPQAIRGDDITVKSYKVESRITSRFVHTTVKSSVVNSGSKAQSIGFNVQIPKRAFITNFTM